MSENIIKAIGHDHYELLKKQAFPDRTVKYSINELKEIRHQLKELAREF